MPQQWVYELGPLVFPDGTCAIVMLQHGKVVAAIPRPGQKRGEVLWFEDAEESPWTEAHMEQLMQFIGGAKRNIAIARPAFIDERRCVMSLTVIESD